ncbi:MAG: aminopeptidase [Candidatus Woesearchaeota archaeon]
MTSVGAEQIFAKCLDCQNKTVLIIYDQSSKTVNALLSNLAIKAGAKSVRSQNLLTRPANIADIQLDNAQIVLFVASKYPGEVPLRRQLREKADQEGFIFGAMQGISLPILSELWDQEQSWNVAREVFQQVNMAKTITIQSPGGTQLTCELAHKWVCATSDLRKHPQQSYNIPGSEVYTCPKTVNGVAVIDGVLGDHFTSFGQLQKTPVHIHITDGRITKLTCENAKLQQELEQYIKTDEHANRIGELGIGCAVGMKRLYTNMLADEKFPGCHIAFGNPYGAKTGANWSSSVHCDGIILNPTIFVDGVKLDIESLGK